MICDGCGKDGDNVKEVNHSGPEFELWELCDDCEEIYFASAKPGDDREDLPFEPLPEPKR